METASVLSDLDILKEREAGHVIIDPFIPSNLGNCSYDVTLGPELWRVNPGFSQDYFNPFVSEHIKEHWVPNSAITASKEDSEVYAVEPGARVILLRAGETILGHTIEFIGGRGRITTMLKARSTLGRSCVCICKCAGWGDVGYINRWTMEIQNTGTNTVVLPVGCRVGQIIFYYTGPTSSSYALKGQYQSMDDLSIIKTSWTPLMMIPKGKPAPKSSTDKDHP